MLSIDFVHFFKDYPSYLNHEPLN